MMYFTHAEIDAILAEDLPRQDETSHAIEMPDCMGILELRSRHEATAAGVAVCEAIARALGLEFEAHHVDGARISPGHVVLEMRGSSERLHVAWKQSMNVMEYCSGIATATFDMTRAARAVNASVRIAATRKAFPGARKLQHYAVLCGGGIVHRAGLSESILIFAQHRAFCTQPGVEGLVRRAKANSPEKFVLVESEDEDDAIRAVTAGCDGVQLDKMTPERLTALVQQLRAIRPKVVINAAGGIHLGNVEQFAATGVDVLVTSSLYVAKPADFGASMRAL